MKDFRVAAMAFEVQLAARERCEQAGACDGLAAQLGTEGVARAAADLAASAAALQAAAELLAELSTREDLVAALTRITLIRRAS